MGVNGVNRSGIWHYSLADGTLVRVPAVIPPLLQGLQTDGGMILGVTHDSIFEFDPEQNKIRVIDQGTTAYRWPCIRVAGSFVSIHYRDLRFESPDGGPTPVINRSVKGTTGAELRPAHLVSWGKREFLLGSEDGRIWRVIL